MRRRHVQRLNETDEELLPSDPVTSRRSSTRTKCAKWLAIISVVLYSFLPCVIILLPQTAEQVLYMNVFVSKEEVESLNQPATVYQLKLTASFKISCNGFDVGVWHILPSGTKDGYKDDAVLPEESIQKFLRNAENIIVYHHGSGSTRATGEHLHRKKIYKVFQKGGYHTIAFDYRGFGDSSGWPSEKGMVNDSLCMYRWIKKSAPEASIYFWGHSMGGAVATLAASELFNACTEDKSSCQKIDGLILQGALMNVRDGAKDNRIVRVVKKAYPESFFSSLVDISMGDTKLATDENLHKVQCPILILHAEDDDIIPVTHGKELFRIYKQKIEDTKQKVRFIKFRASLGYGHMDLFRAPELPHIVNEFIYGNAQDNQPDVLEY